MSSSSPINQYGTLIVVQLRYSYRLSPTPAQRRALARAFGCARVVFNDAVAARRAAHQAGRPYPSDAALSKAPTAAKWTPQRAWLAEVSAVVLQQALKPLHVRIWTCGCGTTHDRDVNAARNILAAGRAVQPVETTSDLGRPGQLSAKQEPTGSAA
jgi:transposase